MSDAFINISYSYFLCSCLCCLLRRPHPTPDRLDCCFLGFFSIFIILSAGKFTEIDFEGISASILVTAKPMELTGGGRRTHAANIIRRYLYFAISVLEWFIFLLFYQEAGCGRRRTQFMFLTVEEIFLPMHTPRSTFPPRNNFRLEHLTTVHMSHFAIKRRCLASE